MTKRELPKIPKEDNEVYELIETAAGGFVYKKYPDRAPPFDLSDVVELNKLYHDGLGVDELSSRFGLSCNIVKKIIVRFAYGDFNEFLDKPIAKPLDKFEKTFESFEDRDEELDEDIRKFNSLRRNRKIFINEIKNGKSFKKASHKALLDTRDVTCWLKKGKSGESPYDYFYNSYLSANKLDFKKNALSVFNKTKDEQEEFIHHIKFGASKIQAANWSDLDVDMLDFWLLNGRRNKKPYRDFAVDYFRMQDYAKSQDEKFDKKSDNIKEFILNVEAGKDFKDSCRDADLNDEDMLYWINRARAKDKHYLEFLNEYNRAIAKDNNNADSKQYDMPMPKKDDYSQNHQYFKDLYGR